MTKAFEQKVKHEILVDTRTYRYYFDADNGQIKRIKLEYLGTTVALDNDNWELVKQLPEVKR